MISLLMRLLRTSGLPRPVATVIALVAVAATVSTFAYAQRRPYGGGYYGQSNSNRGQQRSTNEAGKFDYYALALSWSPSYCAGGSRGGFEPQCNGPRPFSFVLHGLWPQFERGWPQNCASADNGYVPRPVINRMLDIMPSDKLVIHEYRTHGTCSGLGIDGFFNMARALYNKIKIPERYQNVTDPRTFVSMDDILADFIRANPEIKADGIVLQCGGPGPRLREVRICFDKGGNFRSCGANENQSKMCSASRLYLPPVRGGNATSPAGAGDKI